MHDSIIIDEPIFNMSNEIIVHWKDKVSVMLYWKEELSALVIKSQTLHDALKSLFQLIWKLYQTKKTWEKKKSKKRNNRKELWIEKNKRTITS
jgi:hypothetical protein